MFLYTAHEVFEVKQMFKTELLEFPMVGSVDRGILGIKSWNPDWKRLIYGFAQNKHHISTIHMEI